MNDYTIKFRRLLGILEAEHASRDMVEFVRELAQAPVFDDERALGVIGDWTERIDSMLDDGGEVMALAAERNRMQLNALCELRGTLVPSPTLQERREQLYRGLWKQAALPLGVNDAPLFAGGVIENATL